MNGDNGVDAAAPTAPDHDFLVIQADQRRIRGIFFNHYYFVCPLCRPETRALVALGLIQDQLAEAAGSGSGRITTVSTTWVISSAGIPTRFAWSRSASALTAW